MSNPSILIREKLKLVLISFGQCFVSCTKTAPNITWHFLFIYLGLLDILCDFATEYYKWLTITFFLRLEVGQNFMFFSRFPTVHVGIENEHLVFMREWISLDDLNLRSFGRGIRLPWRHHYYTVQNDFKNVLKVRYKD